MSYTIILHPMPVDIITAYDCGAITKLQCVEGIETLLTTNSLFEINYEKDGKKYKILNQKEGSPTLIYCPKCNGSILIDQLNCGIFRHGVIKETKEQVAPHLDKISCSKLVEDDCIFGCGTPFQLIQVYDEPLNSREIIIPSIKKFNKMIVQICDYI